MKRGIYEKGIGPLSKKEKGHVSLLKGKSSEVKGALIAHEKGH